MAGNIKKRIMGSSESKMTASAAIKPEPAFKKTHISHLIDPRSPSAGIERTPIQVGYLVDPFIYLKKKKTQSLKKMYCLNSRKCAVILFY